MQDAQVVCAAVAMLWSCAGCPRERLLCLSSTKPESQHGFVERRPPPLGSGKNANPAATLQAPVPSIFRMHPNPNSRSILLLPCSPLLPIMWHFSFLQRPSKLTTSFFYTILSATTDATSSDSKI